MKKPILYIVLLLSTNFLFAQGSLTFNPDVPNVTDGIVDFTFDLVGGGAEYDLTVEVSFDGGSVTPTFYPIPQEYIISGTLNNVEPSSDIILQWDAMSSFPGQVTSNALLRVTARHVCGTDFTFTYPAGGTETVTYGTISKTYNIGGNDVILCWMDRNLGAEPMPFDPVGTTTNTTEELYGDLFQWGRGDDGHQVVDWTVSPPNVTPTTTTLSTTDDPGHGEFITVSSLPWDWRSTQNNALWQGEDGINNPCPPGWRMPTKEELDAEREDWTEGNNSYGAYESALKWPVGGYRGYNGTLYNVGSHGRVWSSLVIGDYPSTLYFNSGNSFISSPTSKAFGFSVRCVRDN